MDDVVEVTSSGSLESGQPKREGRSKSQGRTVVAQNGTSITGTSVKSKSSQGPSTSGERRRSPRPPANDAELSDPIDGVRGSSSEAAARTAPAQLRSWLERAHQEANALYTSGALNGFRSGVELSLKPCMNHCWSWFSIQILQGILLTLSHAIPCSSLTKESAAWASKLLHIRTEHGAWSASGDVCPKVLVTCAQGYEWLVRQSNGREEGWSSADGGPSSFFFSLICWWLLTRIYFLPSLSCHFPRIVHWSPTTKRSSHKTAR